ncbi:glycosyltransferase family 4 protein [Rhodococcus sp. NPDC079359]|uniref:glycosyltransferase family 4 protein n=1 Tax=Rhodococcus sp. NPDC079359 TaxID=3154961 RepID=UPI00344F3B85
MKIAILHSYYSSDSPSGENITVDAQAAALLNRGHTVKVLGRYTDSESSRALYPLKAAAAASGISGPSPLSDLREFNPDVTHVHNLFPNWGSRWMRDWNGPIIATMHNYRPLCANSILWRDGHDCTECLDFGSRSALRHKCYRNSSLATAPLAFASRARGKHSDVLNNVQALITLNSQAAKVFQTIRPTVPIQVVPNFSPAKPSMNNPMPDGFTYVGRITQEKGLIWLLERWPQGQKLRVVGTGPLEQEVKEVISRRRLTAVVMLGLLDTTEVIRHIRDSYGLLLPSLWSEGLPTVALEALSVGTPLLVSNACSAAKELTTDGAGMTYSPQTTEAHDVESMLAELQTNQGTYRQCAGKLYCARYSESAWIENVEEIYNMAIAARKNN